MTILAEIYGDPISFSDPVRVLSIGRNPIQVLLIRSDPVRVLSIRSDPIRSRFCKLPLKNVTSHHLTCTRRTTFTRAILPYLSPLEIIFQVTFREKKL